MSQNVLLSQSCDKMALMGSKTGVPKHKTTKDGVERMRLYLKANPTCNMREAAEILGVSYEAVRKWKQHGFFDHITPHEARKAGITPIQDLIAPPKRKATKRQAIPQGQPISGAVAPFPPKMVENPFEGRGNIDQPAADDEPLKISSIRNRIKARINRCLHDPQAVSQYAAALKSLAGVQDVELEEIYEQEKIIRIYCPAERKTDLKSVVQVEPIDY